MSKQALMLVAALGWQTSAVAADLKVEKRDFVKHLTFSGELQAPQSVTVKAPNIPSTWKFTIVYLSPEGSRVRPDDLVAEFDASSLLLKRLDAEKKREDARIKIAQKEAEIEEKRQGLLIQEARSIKDLKVEELYVDLDPELITREEAESHQLKYSRATLALEKVHEQLATLKKSARSDLELVRLEHDRADLELRRTLGELGQMRVYASIPGVVVYGENWEGRKFQEGDNAFRGQAVAFLPNMKRTIVVAYVYDTDFAQLREGMNAEVVPDAAPGRIFQGRVMTLPEVASPQRPGSSLKVFRVPVKLLETDLSVMKPGMTARVQVAVVHKQALVLPRRAVRIGVQGETYVMNGEALPRPVPVEVLDGNAQYLLVAPRGDSRLEEGQRILSPDAKTQDPIDEIEWISIRREDFTLTVPGSGVLKAEKAVDIRPPPLARHWQFKIVRMVSEGTQVKRGDFLLQFDGTEIQKQLRDEETSYQKALQEYEKTQSSQKLQMKDLELEVEGALVEREKVENKLRQYREFEGMLKIREAEFDALLKRQQVEMLEKKLVSVRKNAELQLQLLKEAEEFYRLRAQAYRKALDSLLIKAPASGVVIFWTDWRNEKKRVGSSVRVHESVLAIPDLNTLLIEGQVSEIDAGKVKVGGEVTVTLDAIPNQAFTGRIVETSSVFRAASFDRPTKVFEFQVKLNRVDPKRMRPGMAVRLQLVADHLENVLSVPLSALDLGDGNSYLWVQEKGKAVKRQVKVRQDNGVVAVIESGLEEGEKVASRPLI